MTVSDEMYRRIVEAVPEGIWVVNSKGRTIFSNRRMAEILDVDFESMAQLTCFESVFPEDLPAAQAHFAMALEGHRRPFEFRLRRADASAVWVSISCMQVSDDAGAMVGVLGLFSEITDRKRAETALLESEERFRKMADTAPVMIWVTGPDGLSTFFNRRWMEFRGRTTEQELGLGWEEGVHPDDREACMGVYFEAFKTQSNFQTEKRLRRADGEYRSLLCTGVPRFRDNGVFAGYVGCSVDITELRRTQEQALASQKLESLGVLARGIAHDFNNLLGSILADSELVLGDLASDSLARDGIERIQAVAVRASEIVRELMAYAGQENAAFEPVDVSQLVGEMLQLLKVSISKRAHLRVDLQEKLPAVRANAAQLRQVILNLIVNASEALGEEEGFISVSVTQAKPDAESSIDGDSASSATGSIRLEVADTGCGMTEEIRARIFDPFFTTKFAGRGLGLAAVQGIVRSHGGSMSVASEPGQGARFEVLLPCSREPVPAKREPIVFAEHREAKAIGTVLVVEDQDTLRLAVAKMLRKKGSPVIEASNGKTAIDIFRVKASEIDVVLLDMTLPGMSGHEVLAELRRIQPDVKVIITSAYSQEWARRTLGEQEACLYIRKPYRFGELISLLRQARQEKREESAYGSLTVPPSF